MLLFASPSSVQSIFVHSGSLQTSPSRSVTCLDTRRSAVVPIAWRRVVVRASIEGEVSRQLKDAMRAKATEKLLTLRSIRAAFLTARKAEGGRGGDEELSDVDAVAALRKLAKMRQESIDMYSKAGRDDLANVERTELDLIAHWLPKLADEAKVREWVVQAVEQTGASKPGDMGKVMGVIMKNHREEVDGNVVRKIVTDVLQQGG